MHKLFSLIRASMSSDMAIFRVRNKKKSRSSALVPILLAGYIMFMIWSGANSFLEKLAPLNLGYLILATATMGISMITILEGIYKSGPLLFNCKDDQLLLSLPIKRRTVLFVRILKLYVFELLYNSMFLLPVMVAYIRWGNVSPTYYITCIIMLLLLPIIPIAISCFIGAITAGISTKFKYKNAVQIVLSMVMLVGIMYISFKIEDVFNYLLANAESINDFITRRYYPAGAFSKLVVDFNVKELLIFVAINLAVIVVTILILGKFYFRINSGIKNISTSKTHSKVGDLKFKAKSQTSSLIKKEFNTFFKTPVFIVNAGFALVLFVVLAVATAVKFDGVVAFLADEENGFGLAKDLITNNMSVIILALITFGTFMTSITSSVISLEGRNISILKSLPIKTKTILMSKIYAAFLITTPALLVGDLILFIRFRTSILETLLLIILSILMPLISHFIGIIINLKYPKLEWENPTEAVKQSTSSFVAVMIGMFILIISLSIALGLMGKILPIFILLIATGVSGLINLILYLYLIKKSVKDFENLSL